MKEFIVKTSGLTTADMWLYDEVFIEAIKACLYFDNY